MKNKVYYGEYSLKHWVDLILSSNIKLPEYQRSLSWQEPQVKRLIQAFQDNLYIPPVTIGTYKKNGQTKNLVLDGQQRLTSILFAYLSIYPNTDDKETDNPDGSDTTEWTFEKIQKLGTSNEIKNHFNHLNDSNEYIRQQFVLENFDDFFEKNYLGFAFLVPSSNNNEYEQRKYYISVFRSINIEGQTLSNQESREALYYLHESLKPFFNPQFISRYKVEMQNKLTRIDFVRYLSIISQYKKNGTDKIAKGVTGKLEKLEKYYEIYISTVLDGSDSDLFGKFTDYFPNNEYEESLNLLEEYLKSLLGENYEFISIIYSDLVMFGLVNYVLFDNKRLDVNDFNKLRKNISKAYKEFKEDEQHIRNPNTQKYIKERLIKSLDIYQEVIDESA